jgi:hypothetical protein
MIHTLLDTYIQCMCSFRVFIFMYVYLCTTQKSPSQVFFVGEPIAGPVALGAVGAHQPHPEVVPTALVGLAVPAVCHAVVTKTQGVFRRVCQFVVAHTAVRVKLPTVQVEVVGAQPSEVVVCIAVVGAGEPT